MTTYYGIWSGEEWGFCGNEIFHTTMIGLARAQAIIMSRWGPRTTWEACAIGEDGRPEPGQLRGDAEFKVKREFLHCEMAKCAMCGKPAKEWVDVHIRGWMCEQHNVVKVGCLEDTTNDYVVDVAKKRKYVFSALLGCWIGLPMEEEP